jgi:DNA-binding CsgD family transcriptional regulator
MNTDISTESSDQSSKAAETLHKRRRKSRADRKNEGEQVKAMLTSKMTGLEIQRALGLSSSQLKAHLANLLLSGFQMPELTHTALLAASLPEALSNLLNAAPNDLIRCVPRDGAVELKVIR